MTEISNAVLDAVYLRLLLYPQPEFKYFADEMPRTVPVPRPALRA